MLTEENLILETVTEECPSLLSSRWDAFGGLRQRAWVEIDLGAVAHNVQKVKSLLGPKTALMGVVKADAYGHGAVTVAQTICDAGANWLGVATIPEGIELREAGIKAPILILGATHTPEQVRAIEHWQLQPTICTPDQALIFSETLKELNKILPVHVKLDTGMSRLGAPWQQAPEFVNLVKQLPNLHLASIYSHLATADSEDTTIMRQQQKRFEAAISQIATDVNDSFHLPKLHLANSAGTLVDQGLHYDMVRVGLALYGLYPAPHLQPINLKPAMQVKARVTQTRSIEAGTGVSYSYKFIADRTTHIATIGIGYADGIPRNLSNKINVIVRGKLVPQVGTITMDQLMIDVSDIPDLQVGEVVTLLGKDGDFHIQADDWAAILGTISWEILCSFKHRLPRLVVN